ncbi:hypothetical protein BaRGS_00016353, partial [Batillaria attramentaria]
MELSQTAPNDDPLLDLFTREQILQSYHKDLATVLKEKCVTTADEMIEFAEVYREAHPSKPVAASPGNGDVFLRASSVAQETDNAVPRGGSTAGHATCSQFRGGRRGGGRGWYKVSDGQREKVDTDQCRRCLRKGHWARDCPGDAAAILTASRADYTAQLLICDGKNRFSSRSCSPRYGMHHCWCAEIIAAHNSVLSGHLATTRTVKRLLADFYWSGVFGDTRRYSASCSICQKTFPKGKYVLFDKPGHTALVEHSIKLTSDTPINAKPYHIPHHMREIVETEVRNVEDA